MRRKKQKLPVELKRGQKLGPVHRVTTGNLGQNDADHYDVINAKGEKVGTVTHTVKTSLAPPFRDRQWIVPKDVEGNVVVDKQW